MPRRPALLLPFLLAALVLSGLSLWAVPAAVADEPESETSYEANLAASVEAILANPDLPPAFWGLHVRDLATGRTVLSRNADKLFMPASTLKMITSAAALDVLGADYRYTTTLFFFGDEGADGTLRGDLVIRGSGDPSFGSALVPGNPLRTWAQALAAAGVRRVQGRLVGDDSRFADEPYGEGWDVTHIGTESYAPAAGGLAWGDNLLNVRILGAAAGRPARAEVTPAGLLALDAELTTRGGAAGLDVRRALGSSTLVLRGGVPPGYEGTLRVPAPNPTLYALAAFADALREAGIVVDATLVDVDDLAPPQRPRYDGAQPLQAYVSPPLAELVIHLNRTSDNLYAEQMLRSLGDGTIASGAARALAFMDRVGVPTAGVSIRDGSGLSRKNMVTPQALTGLLVAMTQHPARETFRASLATGGGAGTTLRNRLAGVPVVAKTGSIEYARALSGYVTGPRGQTLAFTLMANNYTVGAAEVTGAMDRIVRALATGERLPVSE